MAPQTTELERTLALARAEFAIAESAIHLNHAGVSPLPRRTAAALCEWAEDAHAHGPAGMTTWFERVDRTRVNLGRLLHVPPADIAFTRSTSHGTMLIANALPWRAGENVVLCDLEFPANVYPWQSLAWRGVESRIIHARPDGRVTLDDWAAAIDAQTRVLAVSWVEFGNGFRQDLAGLSQLCRDRGVLLCVDVIQGLGALPLDLGAFGIQAACGAAHKWLLAPQGFGWLYCTPALIGTMIPSLAGWLSVEEPFDFLNYDLGRLRRDARRFEESGPTVVAAYGLEASTSLLLEVGPERIATQVRTLTDQLVEGLTRAGHRVTSPRGESEWSGIVTFMPRHGTAGQMVERLAADKITAVVRGPVVRMSPHFYNTGQELERVMEAVRE